MIVSNTLNLKEILKIYLIEQNIYPNHQHEWKSITVIYHAMSLTTTSMALDKCRESKGLKRFTDKKRQKNNNTFIKVINFSSCAIYLCTWWVLYKVPYLSNNKSGTHPVLEM